VSRGSETQQRPSDRQCDHCGLWFASQGHISHQRNCHLQDIDRRVQEPGAGALEAETPTLDPGAEASDEPPDDVESGASPPGVGDDSGANPQSTEGVGWGAEPPTPSSGANTSPEGTASDVTTPTRTDGGLGLSGPPEPPTRDEADTTATCPACGDDLGVNRDEFREGRTYRCTDCSERWTGAPAS